MNANSALGRIAVVLEFECVMVLRLCMVSVLGRVVLKGGQPQGRSLEVDEGLEGRRRLVRLCIEGE